MKFKKVSYSKLMLDSNTKVQKGYITQIQNNKFQQVNISPTDCKNSIRAFSRINNKKTKKQ